MFLVVFGFAAARQSAQRREANQYAQTLGYRDAKDAAYSMGLCMNREYSRIRPPELLDALRHEDRRRRDDPPAT